MRKSVVLLLNALLLLWTVGVGAQMVDTQPVPKGGDPLGQWAADQIPLQVYVPPELLAIVQSPSFSGAVSGQLTLGADGTFQADYIVTSQVKGTVNVMGSNLVLDQAFADTVHTQGTFQIQGTNLILVRTTGEHDTTGFSAESDTLRLIQAVPLGQYADLVAATGGGPPLAVLSMAKVGTSGTGAASADFNGDGHVDFADFLMFARVYGKSVGDPGVDAKFDLNADGKVDFLDFVLFARQYGKST